MNKIDKRIEKIEKGTPVYDCQGIIVCYIENDADKAWLINLVKEYREENRGLRIPLMKGFLPLAADEFRKEIEQRTRRACFKAGWAWIQNDFGEQFGYDPTDDTDKEDFKQVIEKARGE